MGLSPMYVTVNNYSTGISSNSSPFALESSQSNWSNTLQKDEHTSNNGAQKQDLEKQTDFLNLF